MVVAFWIVLFSNALCPGGQVRLNPFLFVFGCELAQAGRAALFLPLSASFLLNLILNTGRIKRSVIELWHELLLHCVTYWSGQDKLGLALRSYDVASRARTL